MKLSLLLFLSGIPAFAQGFAAPSLTRQGANTRLHSAEPKQQAGTEIELDLDGSVKDELDDARTRHLPLLDGLIEHQLYASATIYTYAAMRKQVKESLNKKEWYRPQLILTQEGADFEDDAGYRRYLKYPVTADAMYEFVDNKKNWRHFLSNSDVNTNPRDKENVKTVLATLKMTNGEIVEFDDSFEDELVYALLINRTDKRITVVFRGSVGHLWERDWGANLDAVFAPPLDPPELIADIDMKDELKIHKGFHNYLFQSSGEGRTKFDDIHDQILSQLAKPEFKDYSLYVTGHSLGGALSQYLSYNLAGSKDFMEALSGPVTAITFASPQVGNGGYNEAFQALEEKGNLRHLRISNENDMVCVNPPTKWGYTQTGVNVHVLPKKDMEMGYRNLKSALKQFRGVATALKAHSTAQYEERLFGVSGNLEVLGANTIEDLYIEHFKMGA